MAGLNVVAQNRNFTHEGAHATPGLSPERQLRRSVMSCLLWEAEFYEDGQSIADRIGDAARQVTPQVIARIAAEAREVMNLRHVPLILLDVLSEARGRTDGLVANTIARVIQRPDELGEFLAIYWRNGRKTVSSQVRKGLARAIPKFSEYQLAKYDRDSKVKLRDVLRIARPKPENDDQSSLWKRVVSRTLKIPDTWEVELSAGKDKKATFERLIHEHKLGYFALLRNLRNMAESGVEKDMVNNAIMAREGGAERILPFRYIAAARAAPQFEPALDVALQAAIKELPKLDGTTIVLVDVSGSMNMPISRHSDMRRLEAAAALGSIINCDALRVFSFSNMIIEVPSRCGMSGVDAIVNSQPHNGTELGAALAYVYRLPHDRLIVITDEQSHDRVDDPVTPRSYMINMASYRNGVGYGRWIHIDGFSEGVLRFIYELESTSAEH